MRTLALPAFLALLALAAASLPGARHAHAEGAIAIAAGGTHTCALMEDGGVKCWGLNTYGQLGDGTDAARTGPVAVCQDYDEAANECIKPLANAIAISAGEGVGNHHTCVVTQDLSVKCWGLNEHGELGTDDVGTCFAPPVFPGSAGNVPCSKTPADVEGLEGQVARVAVGAHHACAVMMDGSAKCWGWNYLGHLGDGTTDGSPTPVDVVGLEGDVVAMSLSYSHTCAVMAVGGVMCWGGGFPAALGAEPSDTCTDIFLGDERPCSKVPTSVCTSRNAVGECGDVLTGAVSVATGSGHSCALMKDAAVKCWGSNAHGALGADVTDTCTSPLSTGGEVSCSWTPVAVGGIGAGAASVAASGAHTCAVTIGGGAWCWGQNVFGSLGNGTDDDASTPTDVCEVYDNVAQNCSVPLSGVTAISLATAHTCALTERARVKCWGHSRFLGTGTTDSTPQLAPIDVPNIGPKVELGDVNCDGGLSSVDALLILQLTARKITSIPCPEAEDVDGDGLVTALDALAVLQRVAGLSPQA